MKFVAAFDTTLIPVCAPVIVEVCVSVAVTDCAPTVLSVTPFAKV